MDETRLLTAVAPRLRWFVAAARAEHLTRAADELGVPQPTLSRGIARLEAELGVPLFTRAGRGVRLTREGRTLLRAAERATGELAVGAAELAGEGPAGVVTLAFLPTLGTDVVPRLIGGFRARHPRTRFELVQGAHALLVSRVREGEADLALTSPLPQEPQLATEALGEEELCLAVPAGHHLATRTDGVRLAEAAGEPFLGFLPGYGLRTTVDSWCRDAGFTPRLAFEGGDTATMRGFVGAGLGVALLPVSHHGPPPGVVELPVTTPRTTRVIGMVWARDRALSPAARAFREFAGTRERVGP
ncbi:LysR family transcriptional regulator [Pseudonocardia ailaonensis]|uniref:LysR family transcriptional regulator n=1 Tax=Pseudonocardia ailaonensis TaxID=367279 RepID=A0ABN2NE29_9PSEU